MKLSFLLLFLLGLVLGVISMLVGIERPRRRARHTPIFSLPIAGAFATMFGATGYLFLRYSGLALIPIILISLALALAAALGVFGFIAGWVVPSAARVVEDDRYRLQGHFARVTNAIDLDGTGKVAYDDAGPHTVTACSLDGHAIAAGAEVVIERIEGGIAYVERWSKIERQLELPGEAEEEAVT
jgi:membrane protein implicated in regulation of membrane protease activity